MTAAAVRMAMAPVLRASRSFRMRSPRGTRRGSVSIVDLQEHGIGAAGAVVCFIVLLRAKSGTGCTIRLPARNYCKSTVLFPLSFKVRDTSACIMNHYFDHYCNQSLSLSVNILLKLL